MVAPAAAVGETHGDGGFVLVDRLDGEAISDRSSLGLGGFGHDLGKQRTLYSDRGRQARARRWQRVLGLQVTGAVADQEEIEAESLLDGAGGKPHHVQGAQRCSRQCDAQAENPRFEFDDVDGNPALSQRNRRSQPANPGADNQDTLYRRHRFLRDTVRIFRYFSLFDAPRASIGGIIEGACKAAKLNKSIPTIGSTHRNVRCSEQPQR